MKIIALKTATSLPLLCLLLACSSPAQEPLARAELAINSQRLTVEVADNPAARGAGLMHRPSLPKSQGMVFVYPYSGTLCMWMKNTMIPLSVAFIDVEGGILNIADMQPHTLEHHCSVAPAQYALEMNLGWFAQNNIASGDKVMGLAGLRAED